MGFPVEAATKGRDSATSFRCGPDGGVEEEVGGADRVRDLEV